MRVGAIVLHYRFFPGVLDTIEALINQTVSPASIVVVDNHSGDDSIEELATAFPSLEVIALDTNRGYAAGMNVGIARMVAAGADAVLLLTHECKLATDALERLSDRLREERTVGAVGPLLGVRSRPGTVFSAGGYIDRRTWKVRHQKTPVHVREWSGRPAHRVQWLDGAALMLRTDAVQAAGPLDESYFMYFEEAEYLLRLRRLGWEVECVPSALAWQEPAPRPQYLWMRNRLRFLARNAPRLVTAREVLRVTRSLLRKLLTQGMSEDVRIQTRALLHFLGRRWGPDTSQGESAVEELGKVASNRSSI